MWFHTYYTLFLSLFPRTSLLTKTFRTIRHLTPVPASCVSSSLCLFTVLRIRVVLLTYSILVDDVHTMMKASTDMSLSTSDAWVSWEWWVKHVVPPCDGEAETLLWFEAPAWAIKWTSASKKKSLGTPIHSPLLVLPSSFCLYIFATSKMFHFLWSHWDTIYKWKLYIIKVYRMVIWCIQCILITMIKSVNTQIITIVTMCAG